MLIAYKYRVYPNTQQQKLIEQTFSACRLVYNLGLEIKKYAWQTQRKNISSFDLCYQLIALKKEYSWLNEVDSQALQASIKKLDSAFINFFKGAGYPKFKNKHGNQRFQCPNNTRKIDFVHSTLTIPKIKNIPIKISREFEGRIKTVTISKTSTGKYFASILVDNRIELSKPQLINFDKAIGIDTGIKSFVISSDGRTFEPNRKLKQSLERLKVLSKRASRKKKGSNNRRKASKRLSALHEKITNQRLDYIHKVTHQLTSDNQAVSAIFVEDLNVAGLLKNHKIAQAISDVSLGKFYEILGYKCKWNGINLIKINRFSPSSKRCSCCGHINQELTLSMREWICEICNTNHDRDFNASQNILWYGKETLLNNKSPMGSREVPVEMLAIAESMKQENTYV